MAIYEIILDTGKTSVVSADNRVNAIRQAQELFGVNNVRVVELESGTASTPFLADEQSQLPTALGIAGQVQNQALPLGIDVAEPVVNQNAPMFATNAEQAELLALAEEQRRKRQEEIRLEQERLEKQRLEEEKREEERKEESKPSASELAFTAEGYLKADNPSLDPNILLPNLTRKLIGAVYSPGESAYYRKYEYSNGDIVSFLVDPNNIDDKAQAFQHEVPITEETYAARPEITTIQANNLLASQTGSKAVFSVENFYKRRADTDILSGTSTQEQIIGKLKNWFIQELARQGKKITEIEDASNNLEYSFDFAQQGESVLPPFKGDVVFDDPFKAEIENVEGAFGEGTGTGTGDVLEVEDFSPDLGIETGVVPGFGIGGAAFASTEIDDGKKIEQKEVVDVAGAGGSMGEILSGYGIDVGPFGVIADDMPGLPPDFFERDDYYVDVTTVTRDVNPLFNRTQDTYQSSDAGFRIDNSGQPEYLESIKIEREINPEISAALEAYKYALEAKTNLSGSLAQVLSTHINATDGLGVGKDAFTAQEIANLRQNVALISATEGLVTYDEEGERQIDTALQQARIGEITAAQRPDVLQQLTNIYSNPVAYGILQQTQEGQDFLTNLQQQATFTPFGQQQIGQEQLSTGTEMQGLGRTTPVGSATNMTSLTGGTQDVYVPPSARDYSRAGELEQGMMLANAASNNILGQRALESEIQERTPFGTNLTESYLAPFMTKRSTESDPFAGAVTAGGS